jgi:hypothetical protein
MADRYLYFILPGLLGAAAVSLAPLLERALAKLRAEGARAAPGLVAAGVAGLALAAFFALRFHERAAVWGSSERLEVDAATHYPDGIHGQIVLARRRLAAGDAEGAIAAIERARARGHNSPAAFLYDPTFRPLLANPRYVALLQDMTEAWLARARALPKHGASSWLGIAHAELFLGHGERAREALAEALAVARSDERAAVKAMQAELERNTEAAAPSPP